MRKKITAMGIVTLILCSAAACDSTKKTTEGKESTTTQSVDKAPKDNVSVNSDMVEGTIVFSDEEGDCMWTIKTANTMYDPTNLEDTYKKDGTEILFKFSGLRMMNRCIKASPIRIEGMQLKE